MSETVTPTVITVEEQINQELVKANVTETIIAGLKEKYLPLKIKGIEDKDTYIQVKEGRKECKSIRIMAEKICKSGREDAVAIQKAWVAKEKDVAGRIGEVEDYLEKQEKDYETEVAKDKAERKRKQDEQFIHRQAELTKMGVLYSDGHFTLSDVSFEMSLIKECEPDIWEENILPKYQEAFDIINAERKAEAEAKLAQEAELKRQQEEVERRQKELTEKETELKKEQERLAAENKAKREKKMDDRCSQLVQLGLKFDFSDSHYKGYNCFVPVLDIQTHPDEKWDIMIADIGVHIAKMKEQEAVRKELQDKRLNELLPYNRFGSDVDMATLWSLNEDDYVHIFKNKKAAFDKEKEENEIAIAEKAAREERERIEKEQAAAELKRQQEEQRKSEEMAQAGDKEKWNDIVAQLNKLDIHEMRSGQYRKKAAILREKLEEIKAL